MVGKNAEKQSSRYRNPEVECPKCRKVFTGTSQMKVGVRTDSKNVPDWKILERWYHCPGCSLGFYYEVEAKPIEGQL
jgi:hypothetical protein